MNINEDDIRLQSHCCSQERDPSGEEDQVLCCSSKVPAGGPVQILIKLQFWSRSNFGQAQISVKFKFWSSLNFGKFIFWSSPNFGHIQILVKFEFW